MKLTIVAVGEKLPAWAEAATTEYLKRMPREARVELREVVATRRSSRGDARAAMKAEAERIIAAIPAGARRIILDEGGQAMDTRTFSRFLERALADGTPLAFVIGGADGLHPDVKRSADRMLSLSALTLPHALARVLLAEQLYRAMSLLKGHPYHRE
ncbi:MAG TPA: 23S rRNA (pseudouridine(1915)-N(3))-methyltransferase RlmH [Pelomicrobium sp.]|nr:23S rRNA (pseudouridine(1915)-N(3))-methyltransferase RlmH [Pelomicrobium sp.]